MTNRLREHGGRETPGAAGPREPSVTHPSSLISHPSPRTPHPSSDLLSDLVGHKRKCLGRLRDMGERQLALVREGNMTLLLELLTAKQQVLMHLQQLDRQLASFRGEAPQNRRWRTPEMRQECADGLAECEALLAQIVAQEEQSEQELTRRRDEAASRLAGIHTAHYARGAYLNHEESGAGQQLNRYE